MPYPTTHTIDLGNGIKVRTRTNRRYAVVIHRPTGVTTDGGYLVPFARVEKRTDNIAAARTYVQRSNRNGTVGLGCFFRIIDLTTGEQV